MGLNGICVKSHGGTDAFGFANAIGVAVDMVAERRHREDAAGVRADDGDARRIAVRRVGLRSLA